MYIGDTLGRRAIYTPDRLAVVDAGKPDRPHYTYRQMNERANRFANWLRDEVGVRKGDRIGIIAHDGVEFLDAFYGLRKLARFWRATTGACMARLAQVCNTTPKLLIFSDESRQDRTLLPESPSGSTRSTSKAKACGSQRFEDACNRAIPCRW